MRTSPVRGDFPAGAGTGFLVVATAAIAAGVLLSAGAILFAGASEAPPRPSGESGPTAAWKAASPGYRWSFPADHWARAGYRLEWWYFTGHLGAVDQPDRRFGYQFTFFRIGLLPEWPDLRSGWTATDLIMGHAALGDLAAGRHHFSELVYRAVPLLGGFGEFPDPVLAWSRAPAGTDGDWSLRWNGAGFDLSMRDDLLGIGFDLITRPRKRLVFQGPGGFSRKAAAGAASQYYSFTRLATEGTVNIGGESFRVDGDSWMDKEFSTSHLAADQVGWDWFSLQLGDGREVMLYLVRDRAGGTDFASGTVVSPAGSPAYLTAADWRLRATGRWRSPETGSGYPSGWELDIPAEGLRLRITPVMEDQENRSRIVPDLHYWEGAVDLTGPAGEPLGRGYVELVGYGPNNTVPGLTF